MRRALLALALTLAVGACSSDTETPTVPTLQNMDTGPRAEAMDAYNAAIDEWNALVDAGPTGYDSYDDWARANGKPVSPPE